MIQHTSMTSCQILLRRKNRAIRLVGLHVSLKDESDIEQLLLLLIKALGAPTSMISVVEIDGVRVNKPLHTGHYAHQNVPSSHHPSPKRPHHTVRYNLYSNDSSKKTSLHKIMTQ